MKASLEKLLESQYLDRREASELMVDIANGALNESQIAAVLSAYIMRSINLEELQGFRDAILELAHGVELLDGETIDVCGTGGDRKNTFNISTLTAFVLAGAGIPVAKHGNYGVSSGSGSSNVMEYFGYRFTNDQDRLQREIEQTGITFMHAPLFHPALKAVGGVRRQLGVKTFFNILGPLVNPASPRYQMSGVFSVEAGRIFSYLLQREHKEFRVVYSLDGYDEVSLTSVVKLFSPAGEDLLQVSDFGLRVLKPEELAGGESVEGSAEIFMDVLQNQSTRAQQDAVVANAALAIQCFGRAADLPEAVQIARESVLSGRALECFKQLMDNQ